MKRRSWLRLLKPARMFLFNEEENSISPRQINFSPGKNAWVIIFTGSLSWNVFIKFNNWHPSYTNLVMVKPAFNILKGSWLCGLVGEIKLLIVYH